MAEVPCVGIPLQTTYVSPNSPETAIFMYSSNTDNQGNVELHLSDVAAGDDVSEKAFTSVFAKLEQDQGSYTISYQDDSNAVLQQNNIGILLGAAALPSNGKFYIIQYRKLKLLPLVGSRTACSTSKMSNSGAKDTNDTKFEVGQPHSSLRLILSTRSDTNSGTSNNDQRKFNATSIRGRT